MTTNQEGYRATRLEADLAALREERDALRLALLEIRKMVENPKLPPGRELWERVDSYIHPVIVEALEKDYGHAPPQA